MPRQRKDHQQTVGLLMQFWELPYVVHFIRVFKKLLKIKKNFTNETLAKELATERLKHDFEEEIVKLVAFVSNEEDCDVHNWENIAEELLEKSGIKFDALKDSTFTELKPEERLRLIKYLVDLVRREKQDELVSFQAKNRKSKNLKFQPVGKDKEGNRYWYFDDKKLYRESCKGGITNLNAVCCTLFEWENLISGMKKSSSKIDREFSKFLKESVFPKVKPQLGEVKDSEKETWEKGLATKKMKIDDKEKALKDRQNDDDYHLGPVSPPTINSEKTMLKKKKKIKVDGFLNDGIDQKPKVKKLKKIKHRDKNIFIREASSPVTSLVNSPYSPVNSPRRSPPRSPSLSPVHSPVPSVRSTPVKIFGNPDESDTYEDRDEEPMMTDRSPGGDSFSSGRRPPYPDDDPGIDLSIFEPRGKRKCVLEQEERRGNRKDWWEGQEEIGNSSDENRGEDDEVSDVSDNGPVKKKRRKKNKPIKSLDPVKSLDRVEHELLMTHSTELLNNHAKEQTNKLYVFSTALANKAAHMVQQGRFNSIIQFHRSQVWDTPYLQFQIHCRPFKPTIGKPELMVSAKPTKLSVPKEPKTGHTKDTKVTKERKNKDRQRLSSPKALISDDVRVDFASKFKKVLSQNKEDAKKQTSSSSISTVSITSPPEKINESVATDKEPVKITEPLVKSENSESKPAIKTGLNESKEKLEIESSLKIHGSSIDGLKKSLAEKVGTNLKRAEVIPNEVWSKPSVSQESVTNLPLFPNEDEKTSALSRSESTKEAADAIDNLRRHEGMPDEDDVGMMSLTRDKVFTTSRSSGGGATPPSSTNSKSEESRTLGFGGSGTPTVSSYPAEIIKRPLYTPSSGAHSPFPQTENGYDSEIRTPPVKMQAKESSISEKSNAESSIPGNRDLENVLGKMDPVKSSGSPRLQENKQRFVDLTQSIRPDNLSYFTSGSNTSTRAFPTRKDWTDMPKDVPRVSTVPSSEREQSLLQSRLSHTGHVAPFSAQSVLQRGIPDLRTLPDNTSRSPRITEIPATSDKYNRPLNAETTRADNPSAVVQSVLTPSNRGSPNDETTGLKQQTIIKDSRSPLINMPPESKKEKKSDTEGRKSTQGSTCKIDLTKVDAGEDDPRIYSKKSVPPERPSLFPCAQKAPGVPEKAPHYFMPGLNQRSSLAPSVTEAMLMKQLQSDVESRLASPGPKGLEQTLSHGLGRGGRPNKESPLFIGHQKGSMHPLSGVHPSRHGEKDLTEKVGSPLLRHDPFSSPFQAQKDAAEVFTGSRSICTSKAGPVPHGISAFPVKDGETSIKYMKRPGSPHLTHDPLASLFQNHRIPGGSGRASSPASSRNSVPLHQQAFSRRDNPGFHGTLPGPISPPLQHSHIPGPFYAPRDSLLCQNSKTTCRSPMTGSALFARESSSNPNTSLSRSNAGNSDLEPAHSSLSRDVSRTLARSPPGVHNHYSSPFVHRETVLNSGQLFPRPPNLSHQTLKSPVDVNQPGRKSFSVESLTGSSERSEHGNMPFANGQSPTGLPFHPRLQGHSSHIAPHGHSFLSGYGGLLHTPNVGERFPYPPNMHTAFSARTSFHPYIRSITDYTSR